MFSEALRADFGGREQRKKGDSEESLGGENLNKSKSGSGARRDNAGGDSGGSVGQSIMERVRDRDKTS